MILHNASDDFGKATLVNQFFYSVFTSSNIILPLEADTMHPSIRCQLVSISISEADVN